MKIYDIAEFEKKFEEILSEALESPIILRGKTDFLLSKYENLGSEHRFIINKHNFLDIIKHKISCDVLASFPINEIRERSIANILRWRLKMASSEAYADWLAIMQNCSDQEVRTAMIGSHERSNHLRQSAPYVGMLNESSVETIYTEFSDLVRGGNFHFGS